MLPSTRTGRSWGRSRTMTMTCDGWGGGMRGVARARAGALGGEDAQMKWSD